MKSTHLIVLACFLQWRASDAFLGPSGTGQPRGAPLFYKDDKADDASAALVHTRQHKPSPLQPLDNSIEQSSAFLSSWKRTDELWNQEWHDAFIRNGLVDFTPPLTDHLFCLMVGEGLNMKPQGDPKLPWQPAKFLSQAQDTKEKRLPFTSLKASRLESRNGQRSSLSSLSNRSGGKFADPTARFRYDCIFDTSWMNDLAEQENFGHRFVRSPATVDVLLKNAGTLLVEANQALQEHGIYVVITHRSMASTPIMKGFLLEAGQSMGMQWHFDLEEISRGDVHVSVARKYYTGKLPASAHCEVAMKRAELNPSKSRYHSEEH